MINSSQSRCWRRSRPNRELLLMRKFLILLAAIVSPALAQTPAGTINSPIYATGYISQVGGTNVTTKIPAQPNHPTNQNVYLTSAVSGTWSIQLPNPAFEGQILSFSCGGSAAAISITSSDGSTVDSNLPTACVGASTFAAQFDQRNNIWRYIGYGNSAGIVPSQLPAFVGGDCTSSAGSVALNCRTALAPKVENNTALSALASTYATSIVRLGFSNAGDSPPVLYTPSNSACTLNAGAGDGGSQVPTSNGKCWIATVSVYDPRIWGAKGDGATDDTAALIATTTAAPAWATIDLMGRRYVITAPVALAANGQRVTNGEVILNNPSVQFFYAFVPSDYATFDHLKITGSGTTGTNITPKYQGGIFGGDSTSAGALARTPANKVTITNCYFSQLTVGVWSGGAIIDPVPYGWVVQDNTFENIVGYPGQSEGYGVIFTPSNDGVISNNRFFTIRRHAIYVAGEASRNIVDANIINGVDNMAVQSNTSSVQNAADSNIFTNNQISNLTRSIPYGYASSVGIALVGKATNAIISGNNIVGALDSGISILSEISSVAYSFGHTVQGNKIRMAVAATDAGIRIDGVLNGVFTGNDIELAGYIYGFVIVSSFSTTTNFINVDDNKIYTTQPGAIGARIILGATRNVTLNRNSYVGFNAGNSVYDSSSAGNIYTDANSNLGYYGADADLVWRAQGTGATDQPMMRDGATLTDVRSICLDKTRPPPMGATFVINRTGGSSGGPFNRNIYDGGSGAACSGGVLIRGIATGKVGRFAWSGTSWEAIGYGDP